MDQVRMQYLRIYTKYLENEGTPCPYCGHGVGYADLHDDNCFMLDIIAYIDNGVPLPTEPAPSAPAPFEAVAGDSGWELDSFDYATAMLGSELMLNSSYSKMDHHFKALDQWKREALETEATLQAELRAAQSALNAALVHQSDEAERYETRLADASVGAEQMARTLDDLAGDHVRFRMMLATALGLDDNELLDESNDEICERVTAIRARLAEALAAGVEGSKFVIGQEVIVLDGTSLVGKIIGRSETADAYKVAVEGSTGRWYDASDLAAV